MSVWDYRADAERFETRQAFNEPSDADLDGWIAGMRRLIGDGIETQAPPMRDDFCDRCEMWGATWVPATRESLCGACHPCAPLKERWEAAE